MGTYKATMLVHFNEEVSEEQVYEALKGRLGYLGVPVTKRVEKDITEEEEANSENTYNRPKRVIRVEERDDTVYGQVLQLEVQPWKPGWC